MRKVGIFSWLAAVTYFLSMAWPQSVQAQSNTWATGTGNWVDAANWTGGVIVPGATSGTTNADVATFGSLGLGGTITVDAYRNIGGITFGTNNYTLSGGLLVLTGGATAITGTTGSLAISSNIQLESASTFTGSGTGGGLTISGNIAGNAAASVNYALTLAGTSLTNEVSGEISDGTGGGTVSIVKAASTGTWELSSANAYSGGTSITTGSGGNRLLVSHANALGTGDLTIGNSTTTNNYGQLQLAGGINLAVGPSGKIVVASGSLAHTVSATSGAINNVSGNNSYAGDVEAGGGLFLASQSDKLTLSGDVYTTYASGSGGSTRTLSLSGAGDGEISGRIYSTNNRHFAVIKSGTGTWTLSNPGTGASRNALRGATTINGGTLLINTDDSLTVATTTVNTTGTLGGNGIIGGATTIATGGTLAPGNSADVLTFNADLTQQSGSFFEWELFDNTSVGRGTEFDGVDFTGTRVLTIQTGVTANLVFNGLDSTVDWSNSFWDSNQSWLVSSGASTLTLDSLLAIFDTTNVSLDSGGQNFSVTGGSFSWAASGNDLYLNYAIPEPSTYAMLLGGLGLLAFLRRRSKS